MNISDHPHLTRWGSPRRNRQPWHAPSPSDGTSWVDMRHGRCYSPKKRKFPLVTILSGMFFFENLKRPSWQHQHFAISYPAIFFRQQSLLHHCHEKPRRILRRTLWNCGRCDVRFKDETQSSSCDLCMSLATHFCNGHICFIRGSCR